MGWRPTQLHLRLRRYRCDECACVWQQDTTSIVATGQKLSYPAALWALKSVVIDRLSIARVAANLGVSWHTANDAVLQTGRQLLIDNPNRLTEARILGVDEHVWRHTRWGNRYVTVVIDLTPVTIRSRSKGTTTAMSIVAHCHPFVVGVDTHARKHVYTILTAATGAVIDTKAFPTTAAGINRAIAWVARRTDADVDTLWVIEGAASYGAIVTGIVASHGYTVAAAPRIDTKQHRGVGKTDTLDSHRIAVAALPLSVDKWRRPRLICQAWTTHR